MSHLVSVMATDLATPRSQAFCDAKLKDITTELNIVEIFTNKTVQRTGQEAFARIQKLLAFYLWVCRPVLLGKPNIQHIFLNMNGTAPRASVTTLSDRVMIKHIGKRIPFHNRRHAQHTTASDPSAGLTEGEITAMAVARGHSRQVADRYYKMAATEATQRALALSGCKKLARYRAKRRDTLAIPAVPEAFRLSCILNGTGKGQVLTHTHTHTYSYPYPYPDPYPDLYPYPYPYPYPYQNPYP